MNDNEILCVIESCGFHNIEYPHINSDFMTLKRCGIYIYHYRFNAFFVKDIEFDDLTMKLAANKYNL